jgi:hypothetical protein
MNRLILRMDAGPQHEEESNETQPDFSAATVAYDHSESLEQVFQFRRIDRLDEVQIDAGFQRAPSGCLCLVSGDC